MKLIETTIGALLERNAHEFKGYTAAVFCENNVRWNWEELDEEVNKVAKGLIALGVKRGDHVAIWGTNVPEWYLTELAVARMGAVLITINPEWKHTELEYAIRQSDTNVLVMMPGFEKKVRGKSYVYDYVSMIREICPALPCEQFPELRKIVITGVDAPDGMLSWATLLKLGRNVSDAELAYHVDAVQPEDTVLIQYTSGTTGFPKGAMLSHFNVVNDAMAIAAHQRLGIDDLMCGPVPFYHCFGSILLAMGSLVSGAAMVIPSAIFDGHKVLETVQRERCTVLYGVPTMFIAELEDLDFEKFDLHSLRTGIMAGAPVSKELFEAVTKTFGAREMTIAYGLTEASPVTHQTTLFDPEEKRFITVGKPLDHTQSRIVDTATLETLPPGKVGEIWVKGFNVMKGYYKKPEETAKTIVEDGWLRTGDLGVMDELGYYRIVGRLKELIIVGGHNVYPAEVEQSLYSLLGDKVEIVQVVGVPHPKLQEVVGLAVKCVPGETLTLQEIQERCEGELEWAKIPRHLLILDDFSKAMTVTGKIQKFKLAKMFEEELVG